MNKQPTICIVDDDSINRFIFSKTIETQKLSDKVLTFSNGQLAIAFLLDNISQTSNLPDILFIDINMPIMNGWQFIEEYMKIKLKIKKKIMIYLLSASLNPIDLARSKEIDGISGHIIKPINPEKLKEIFLDFNENHNNQIL
jgi:CheY-like chemotaxis protein